MKKTLTYCLTVLLVLAVTLIPAFAEENGETTPAVTAESAESVPSETVPEEAPPAETAPAETLPADPSVWQEMLDYLAENGVNAGSFGEDTVDKMLLLGEQFADLKEQGYTWEERLAQLVTPENILTTASALVLVVSTIVLFVMKSRQRTATLIAAKNMQELKEAYDREAEENNALRESVQTLKAQQEQIAEVLKNVSDTTSINAKALKTSRDCSVGVANMVKDVFLNSRSLDHAGKDLMIRNYLNATGESGEDNTETAKSEGGVTA